WASLGARFYTAAVFAGCGLDVTGVPVASNEVYQQALADGEFDIGMAPETQAVRWRDQLRILGQMRRRRSPLFPDAPTFTELGLFEVKNSFTLILRQGAPQQAFDAIRRAGLRAAEQQDLRTKLEQFGLEMRDAADPPAEPFADEIRLFRDFAQKA